MCWFHLQGSLPPVAAEIISRHSSSEMSSPISAKICARPLGWIAVTLSCLSDLSGESHQLAMSQYVSICLTTRCTVDVVKHQELSNW